VPAFFYLLSLHHRTLVKTVSEQHPEQRPLPFRYVVAIVSGLADALEAAAKAGVVHLDIKSDNVMVDDPEAMDFEAEQRDVVDYRKLVRRFERPPVTVVIDWGVAMHFNGDWVHVVTVGGDGRLALADGAQPWGNASHACPELHLEWKRANDALAAANIAVAQAHRAKTEAAQRTLLYTVCCVVPARVACGCLQCRERVVRMSPCHRWQRRRCCRQAGAIRRSGGGARQRHSGAGLQQAAELRGWHHGLLDGHRRASVWRWLSCASTCAVRPRCIPRDGGIMATVVSRADGGVHRIRPATSP
jgi:hypothetical protein